MPPEATDYAAYVWPAYGIALIVLLGMAFTAWRALRKAERAARAGGSRH